MLSVRLHVSGNEVWALCKCRACGDVHKYPLDDALAGPIECKRCGHPMNIKGAVIEAVDQRGSDLPPQRSQFAAD